MKIPLRRWAFPGLIVTLVIAGAIYANAVIASFTLDRKKAQARTVREDLKELDTALMRYALETEKNGGFRAEFSDLKKYLKPSTSVYQTGGRDPLGNLYEPFIVNIRPSVPPETHGRLSSVADAAFWSPYR